MELSDSVLKDFLIDSGLVSRGQLELLPESKPLSRALIEGGVLSEEEVRRAGAHALGVPFVVLEGEDISPEALELIPEPLCRAKSLVAYAAKGGTLEVALLDLKDLEALEPLRARLLYKISPRLTSRESLTRALLMYQKLLKERFGDKLTRERDPHRLLLTLLRHARHQGASEIHIETRPESGLLVRYRHGGSFNEAMRLPSSALPLLGALRERASVHSRTLPQDGRFSMDLGDGIEASVRVSSLPTEGGERLVLRLQADESRGYTLFALGLHGAAEETVRAALEKKGGMILLCGPRRSGRTTLLYTLLDLSHAPERLLMSVEETIAQRLPYVAQTQAREEGGLSMAAALRASLRQDPDVVCIDSISDRETASLALSAASRGVLVLASIEAGDPDEALRAMRALGASEADLSMISVVIHTGLVRKLCDKQTREKKPALRQHLAELETACDFAAVLGALKEEGVVGKDAAWKDIEYSQATGCSECERGYRGETGVFGVRSAGRHLSLAEDALFKAAAGITSLAEAAGLSGTRSAPEEA